MRYRYKPGQLLRCVDIYYTEHFYNYPLTLNRIYKCTKRKNSYTYVHCDNGTDTYYNSRRFVLYKPLVLNNNIKVI